MPRHRRLLFVGLFTLQAVFLMSARCVEHDALRRGPDGDWHIYGEIYNDTDVQGLDMVMDGSVLDADGAAVRTARAVMCPGSLSPGTFSLYDVRFPNTAVLVDRPDSFKVSVVSGKASSDQLPSLRGTYQDMSANARLDIEGLMHYDATFAFDDAVPMRREAVPVEHIYLYCIAMYGPDGDVVGVIGPQPVPATKAGVELTSKKGTAPVITPSDTVSIPVDAVEIRFLLWQANADASAEPLTKVAISDPLHIVNR